MEVDLILINNTDIFLSMFLYVLILKWKGKKSIY